jgi:hypothetical protein
MTQSEPDRELTALEELEAELAALERELERAEAPTPRDEE